MANSKGLGIKFPIRDGDEPGNIFDFDYNTRDALKSRLVLLFTSDRGERLFYPEWGSGLRRLIFEQNDDTTRDKLLSDIKKTAEKNIGGLTIESIDAVQEGTEVLLTINFLYKEGTLRTRDSLAVRFSA